MTNVEYRPKKSYLLYLLFGFLGIVTLADLFGVAPIRSVWSNFERMEGLVTMLHLGAFFIVISSVFKEVDWKRWWNTSLSASLIMVLYSALQILGVKTINQGGVRVDGTFGNAIYLAVYMLFHIFIAMYFMFKEWQNKSLRYTYATLIVLELIVLYYTATRGAVLGLVGGVVIFTLLNIRNKEQKWVKKISVGVIALLIVLTGGLFLIRNTTFVQESPVLSRFAGISLSELHTQGRYYVWPMAWQGIKDRPLLGWGQENFNYVFQKYYNPEMHNLEPWFDRAHSVFLDWAIAGGLLALFLYFSLYVVALYFIWRKGEFSYLEKSVLTSLLAAYFFHNIFVFDHLFSYVLFFALLAYLHGRSRGEPLWKKDLSINTSFVVLMPMVVVLLLISIYFINWKPLNGNIALINALREVQSGQTALAVTNFEKAYGSSPVGRQEAVEQLEAYTNSILSSSISVDEKNKFYAFVKSAILNEASKLPEDARFQLLAGAFLASTGADTLAETYLNKAESLAPNKQDIYLATGASYLTKNDIARALTSFKRAYELAPNYKKTIIFYLVGAIYADDRALERQLLSRLTEQELSLNDIILSAYNSKKRFADLVRLLEIRKKFDPANANTYDNYIKEIQNQK